MASPQSNQLKRPSQLSRTVSRALRTLGRSEGIQCTRSLIQAYNANDAGDEMGVALHQWLDAYVDEFSKRKVECMQESLIREYALLATINVKTSAAAELLRRVYDSFRACIRADVPCSYVIVVALENMLRFMDKKVVERETHSLISLANDLLSLTDPKKWPYTRDAYPFLVACLLTLERILIVIHDVECARSKQDVVEFFRNKLRTHLNSIAAKQKYYPFAYNAQLIRCNIDGLIKGNRTDMLLNAGRRTFYALCGRLYLFQGIRELAVMRLDFAAIDAGMQRMNQAFSGLMDKRVLGLKEVMHAAAKSKEKQDFVHIMECYEKYKYPSCWDRIVPNKLKTIKFALVTHLTLFAAENSSSHLSDQAFRLLSSLAVNDDTAHWRVDPDIYERLLDALASIGAKKQTLRQHCLQLLHQMESTSIRKHQIVTTDWRGSSSIEQKLDMKCDNESEIPVLSLFDTVRKQLGLHLTHERNLELKQKLIKYYQDEQFAKVSLLLDDINKRHIANLDFHIVEYEMVDTKNQVTNDRSSTNADQMAHNLERSQRVQKAIKLQDIFARRCQRPSGPEEEASRVLLLGSPGIGKTSLSKRLCYGWATNGWGSMFHRVYMLPVRKLTESRLQSVKTLEAAISILLFSVNSKSDNERNALHRQIKDELDDETTLFMLDGLDEASGNATAQEIVTDALSRSCCILVLSRPHNLGDVRSRMDIHLECLGLNAKQLEAYVRGEVPDTARELVQFLKRSPMVWDIAQVPINAQILCTLWNSEVRQSLRELKSVNLKTLYSAMIEYVWKRFEEKATGNVDRKSVFSSLESVAFKSMSKGKIEIPREFMMMNPHDTAMNILLDSGFLLFYMEGQVFQFAHLSFHEFFAGQFLARALEGTEKEIKEAKKYIGERKYYDTSRVTLSFMTQCFCKEEDDSDESDCIERLKQLLSILDEDPREVIGFQHTLLKLRTLDAFLSVCGNCTEDIRSDDYLQSVVQSGLALLEGRFEDADLDRVLADSVTCLLFDDQIIAELREMSSLVAYLPEFLLNELKNRTYTFGNAHTSSLAKLVSYAPEQLLQTVPVELKGDEGNEGYNIGLELWFRLFASAGPESAVLALDQLKNACQDQSEGIRELAYVATIDFLKTLPDREDLQSLCQDAMKDRSAYVRKAFMERLKDVTFESNSVASDLAWTLTVEATKDDNEQVRRHAVESVVREDQTSEESIEKMVQLLLEYEPICVDAGTHYRLNILDSIISLLRRFPTKFTAFLPYLNKYCNDPGFHGRYVVAGRIEDLSSHLPTPQLRELGEMIARIYCDVEDPIIRKGLVNALYKIGRKVPDFMTDFPDVFSKACNDIDDDVRELAKDRTAMTMLASVDSVDAINEVFWKQSCRVKTELLLRIHRERMINVETAEVVLEMVVNWLESNNGEQLWDSLTRMIWSLARFRSLSRRVIHSLLVYGREIGPFEQFNITMEQPLDMLLEYFWDTADERVVPLVADKLISAFVTYKAGQGGKSIVYIMENGKKTKQEVPTDLGENLIGLVKDRLREVFGDIVS